MILAIDPGNEYSGYAIVDEQYGIHGKGKVSNAEMMRTLEEFVEDPEAKQVVIERVASYGQTVGRHVFETCEWYGRFAGRCEERGFPVDFVYRLEEKMALCHSARANDATIHRALIDRFAKHDREHGKGTKANPDTFYGFARDAWAAYAVAVTWLDKQAKFFSPKM